ncbi:MAG: ribonucleoside-diphosphate reductase [Candidatus Tyloplasma litorale]|nr:MAG: ribonucleoside-diphosphate reductase [Mycoplasmatales bacterium]
MSTKHIELNNLVKKQIDGFWNVNSDLEAAKLYWDEEFKMNYSNEGSQFMRIRKLVNEGIYNPKLLDWYNETQIKEFHDFAKSFKFEFKSYMAIKKFFENYATKSKDGKRILESYIDRVIVTSMYLGKGNEKQVKDLIEEILTGRYQPATPTFQDAGKWNSGEMVSCFLLEMDDNLNSIAYNLGTSMHLSKFGGGVAINVSNIRSRGESLRGVKGVTAGVMPILKLMEDSFAFANKLDQRNGAGAAYLSIFHWDIIEFLDTKKINADEKNRLQLLALGVTIPNIFFDLAKNNEEVALFAPLTVREAYGQHMSDMDMNKMYNKLKNNTKVEKQFVSARKLLLKLAQTQMESGYPYLVFLDNANDVHPLKDVGKIKMSNLCTEIFQLQEKSIINPYLINDEIKKDINCNLGSLNITNVMQNKDIEKTVSRAMDALTAVVELTDIKDAPGIRKANQEMRSVGLGALDLHGFLAKNRIMYESEIAREFASVFFAAVNYYSIKRSTELAVEKKFRFLGFEKSEYAKGTYFQNYLDNEFLPTSDKVKKLFDGIKLPTKRDWFNLKNQVMVNGMYHAYRMAIAPNQSTAYIANATPSVMPITSQIESRTYGNSSTYYPMPHMKRDNVLFYKSAYNMDQNKIIDMVAAIQPHVDQGISTILFVDSDTSTADLAKLYLKAFKSNLKSIYYTRTKNKKIEECESCHA